MTPRPESAVFRFGLPADAPAIRAILMQASLSAPSAGDLERVTHSPIGEILTFICEENEQLVGVLQWRHLREEAEILDLAIAANHRRRGHATFLLEKFVQHVAQTDMQEIFLEVRESNAAAIALYEKFGFRSTGRRPNYYRNPEESALLMSLSLRA